MEAQDRKHFSQITGWVAGWGCVGLGMSSPPALCHYSLGFFPASKLTPICFFSEWTHSSPPGSTGRPCSSGRRADQAWCHSGCHHPGKADHSRPVSAMVPSLSCMIRHHPPMCTPLEPPTSQNITGAHPHTLKLSPSWRQKPCGSTLSCLFLRLVRSLETPAFMATLGICCCCCFKVCQTFELVIRSWCSHMMLSPCVERM